EAAVAVRGIHARTETGLGYRGAAAGMLARRLSGRVAALVSRLRRSRGTECRPTARPRQTIGARKNRGGLGHRMFEPLPALHEHLRLSRASRPCISGRL